MYQFVEWVWSSSNKEVNEMLSDCYHKYDNQLQSGQDAMM